MASLSLRSGRACIWQGNRPLCIDGGPALAPVWQARLPELAEPGRRRASPRRDDVAGAGRTGSDLGGGANGRLNDRAGKQM